MRSTPHLDALRLKAQSVGLLLLRLGAGGLIWAYHMHPKLTHFEEELSSFPDPMGIGHAPSFFLALLSEGVCSLLVAAGLGARLFSLPIVFTMLMVLVVAVQGFEGADVQAALLYALPYAAITLCGPGRFSLDHVLRSRFAKLSSEIERRLAPASPALTNE
jgi:putative oxidoreductase